MTTSVISTTPDHIEHRIRTSDGRVLAVAEWGDPNGVPLVSIHGTPGGRISWWTDPTIYARHGLRRITFDRPGYGESTRMPGRTVVDIVPDVSTIADALGVDRFAVTGGSGGRPHALALAALMGDRVLRCMVAVSIAPYGPDGLEHADWLAGMTEGNVIEFEAALAGEEAIRAVAERERKTVLERLDEGRTDFLGDAYELADSDKAQMATHLASMAGQLRDGLASGVDGWVDDGIAFTRPWGFEVSAVRVPVYLTYGREDTLVPAAHGDWLAERLPHANVVTLDTGHMGDDGTVEDEMTWLAGER